jgi:hypothetical protein
VILGIKMKKFACATILSAGLVSPIFAADEASVGISHEVAPVCSLGAVVAATTEENGSVEFGCNTVATVILKSKNTGLKLGDRIITYTVTIPGLNVGTEEVSEDLSMQSFGIDSVPGQGTFEVQPTPLSNYDIEIDLGDIDVDLEAGQYEDTLTITAGPQA